MCGFNICFIASVVISNILLFETVDILLAKSVHLFVIISKGKNSSKKIIGWKSIPNYMQFLMIVYVFNSK